MFMYVGPPTYFVFFNESVNDLRMTTHTRHIVLFYDVVELKFKRYTESTSLNSIAPTRIFNG